MNLAEAFKNRKVQIGLAAAALAIVMIVALLFIFKPTSQSSTPSTNDTTAVATPEESTPATEPAAEDPTPTSDGTCIPPEGTGFIPVRYAIESLGVDADVLSLNVDDAGLIAAPPKNQPKTASWWNGGPAPASDAGQVVMSIHTYRNGGAVGNQLYEGGEPQLKPGDTIKLWDAEGRTACYEYVDAEKIMVEDYNPDSDLMVRLEGDPALAIIICWDHKEGTDDWDSRVFFRFKPVTDAS
ncbi:class F sortase [Arachnia propionica]|uniref:Class F sortase n=1 Tax=Arachnia propionica TaxID=1750 RepID=A0A3P1T638_9ACTN|nr:class F sortase [Arachnia propionica]MDO5083487.1 class F sortase [Arachnia propionica]RRD04961.1 class F sortase [Arachnia propionica]